jgi:hypothetical protein
MTAYVTGGNSEFMSDVGLGLWGGTAPGSIVRRVTGLGQLTIAGSGVAANDIWPNGGLYPWVTGGAAISMELVSTSANDTAAGTGAQSIIVNGLDFAGNEISETRATNGTTAVALTNQYYRINSLSIVAVGSGLRNLGTISVRDAGGGTVRSVIPISANADLSPGVSKGTQYTVPAGHALLIYDIDIQINSSAGGGGTSKGADVLFYFRGPAANAPVRLPRALSTTDIVSKNLDPKTPIFVGAQTDFQLRCSYTSTAGVILSGSWEGFLYRRIP